MAGGHLILRISDTRLYETMSTIVNLMVLVFVGGVIRAQHVKSVSNPWCVSSSARIHKCARMFSDRNK
jgi:hypothetical protein